MLPEPLFKLTITDLKTNLFGKDIAPHRGQNLGKVTIVNHGPLDRELFEILILLSALAFSTFRVRATFATKSHIDINSLMVYCGDMKLFLNASEVAKLLNVDRATVTRWVKKGLFKGVIRPAGVRNWRIPLAAYEEFVKSQL